MELCHPVNVKAYHIIFVGFCTSGTPAQKLWRVQMTSHAGLPLALRRPPLQAFHVENVAFSHLPTLEPVKLRQM